MIKSFKNFKVEITKAGKAWHNLDRSTNIVKKLFLLIIKKIQFVLFLLISCKRIFHPFGKGVYVFFLNKVLKYSKGHLTKKYTT